MIISSIGDKMALYDDYGERYSPVVDHIYRSGDTYICTDSMRVTYFKKTTDVKIHFALNQKGALRGSIFNDYFNNSDYINGIQYYDKYLNNLKNRIYFHSMHEYFNKGKTVKKKIK